MEFKRVTLENIETEHICCAITDKKGECCVSSKKAWLKERMQDGLVFEKLDVRAKVFIEYIPAEYAWAPVEAEGYYYINCLWVAGQFKGQGYGGQLLERCIAEAKDKGKKGIVVLSAKKKMPYLSDPSFFKRKGFTVVDTASPYYELLALAFNEGEEKPKFRESAKMGRIEEKGWVLYYTSQCPHTAKYVPLLSGYASDRGIEMKMIRINSLKEAHNAPNPFTTYALFYNGEFVTNEILSEKSFDKLLSKLGIN